MCTVTWFHQPEGYHLFFNRDERRDRCPAVPPQVFSSHPTAFVAPIDAEAGGSWLATNERGLTVCLLNYTAPAPAPEPNRSAWTSRGLLVLEAVRGSAGRDLGPVLARQELIAYRPFLLVGLEIGKPAVIFRWDGASLDQHLEPAPRAILSTSSRHPAAAVSNRLARFDEFRNHTVSDDPSAYRRFHADHQPEAGPLSVCMHRDDAQTVSFSHVSVDPREVRFHYCDHCPCAREDRNEIAVGLTRRTSCS